jgi:hypothetical protein
VVADGCSGTQLAGVGGASTCSVTVAFTPSGTAPRSATLTASATPGGSTGIPLNAIAAASLALSAPTAFSTPAGTTTSQTITVTNTGGQTSGTPSVSLSPPGAFQVQSNGCTNAIPGVGAGTSTCDIVVAFSPSDTSPQSATLSVSATPGGAPSAQLSGAGTTPVVTLTVDLGGTPLSGVYQYAPTNVQTSATTSFTIRNTGNVSSKPLSFKLAPVSQPAQPYAPAAGADGCSGTALVAGGSCDVGMAFAPPHAGPFLSVMTVSDGSASAQAQLYGPGLNPTAGEAVFTVTDGPAGLPMPVSSWDFGVVHSPATSSASFLVVNYGRAAYQAILERKNGGGNGQDWSANGCPDTQLQPYGSTMLYQCGVGVTSLRWPHRRERTRRSFICTSPRPRPSR